MQNVINEEIVKNEILQGLLQVDSSFFVENFETSFESKTRKLNVYFTAKNSNNETVEINNVWG